MSLSYRDSGVNVEGGGRFVKKIAPIVKSTFSNRVITGIGGFGALFSASFPEMKDPILVSGTDGVGTKLKIAQMMRRHDTIGIDAVAMCVNDILVSGARPLFFLDYIACGALNEEVMVSVVSGMAEGCRLADCSLIGGETAEHPSVMAPDEYDIAGFAVGAVDRKNIIDGSKIRKGDVIIGLPSSGVHSNGYSLLRRLFFEIKKYTVETSISELGSALGEALLIPTRIYCRSVVHCLERGVTIKGMVHITGGGFYENIPRILPADTAARILASNYEVPAIFKLIQREGDIDPREMYSTFNMGIGMMLVTGKEDADKLIALLEEKGEHPILLGEILPLQDERMILG